MVGNLFEYFLLKRNANLLPNEKPFRITVLVRSLISSKSNSRAQLREILVEQLYMDSREKRILIALFYIPKIEYLVYNTIK